MRLVDELWTVSDDPSPTPLRTKDRTDIERTPTASRVARPPSELVCVRHVSYSYTLSGRRDWNHTMSGTVEGGDGTYP